MATAQEPHFGTSAIPQHSFPQPIQAQNSTIPSHPLQKFKRALIGLGIAEVIIGTISVSLAIGASVVATDRARYNAYDYSSCETTMFWSYVSQGVWCGLLVSISGILGIVLWKKTSKIIYIINMTVAIFTANVVAAGAVLSSISAVISIFCDEALIGMHAVVAILCFAAIILLIIHAALCCSGVCYSPHQQAQVIPQAQCISLQDPRYQQQCMPGPNGEMMIVMVPTHLNMAASQDNSLVYKEPIVFN